MQPNPFPRAARRLHRYAVGLLFVAIQSATAGIVYQQPSVWTGNGTDVGNAWTSHIDTSVTGFRTNDNFSLSAPASINQASWLGIYVNSADLTDASPNTNDWVIRFQADNAGTPGSVLLSSTQTAAQVATQVLGNGLYNNNPVTIYEFTALFPASFSAAANTTYWFSPLSRATTFSPLFSWIEGAGGDAASFQSAFTACVGTGSGVREGDRAFALASVPEPSILVLIGVGLSLLVASLRRRSPTPAPAACPSQLRRT